MSLLSQRSWTSVLWRWLLRPSLWVAMISVVAYWDDTALHGSFVYDDSGSVFKNVVVNGHVPWTDVFSRDYWGTSMAEPGSHKSFRPITTMTFKLNYLYSEMETYPYHLVNVGLHGLVVFLVTEASAFVFDGGENCDVLSQIITGFLFGLHPVHAEAVSNITSRGEMLMSIFFLLAFLSFASHIPSTRHGQQQQQVGTTPTHPVRSFLAIYMIPFLCMALSLFSKEQGATTLITLVLYDFINHHSSVQDYLAALFRRDPLALAFLRRTICLAIQTMALCGLRYWLNGETLPDFIFDQNPAGFSSDRFTRVFSVSWVYCLYIYDAIYPKYLSPDWSGQSIPLIESVFDMRVLLVVTLWVFASGCLVSLCKSPPKGTTRVYYESRRILLMAFWAFLVSPFLLSSNLLVVVGLMKADRVIYLPLLGFCMMEALVFQLLFGNPNDKPSLEQQQHEQQQQDQSSTLQQEQSPTLEQQESTPDEQQRPSEQRRHVLSESGAHWIGHVIIMVQLMLFVGKVHERNLAWSHSLSLWTTAYAVNPKSRHTMYNCGYELSLDRQFQRAEQVMRPIGSARVEGPSNTFVYAMVLYNLNRCDEANRYIDDAMEVLAESKREGGKRNQPHILARTESNLLVAKAFCTSDLSERAKVLYNAVQADQRNDYAVQQAHAFMQQLEKLTKLQP